MKDNKPENNIPKGRSDQDIAVRRNIIKEALVKMKGQTVQCHCLGGVPVVIIGDSINEIANHASKGYKSTLAALLLPEMIENAVYYRMHLPKNNQQRKKFRFIFIYELHCKTMKYGTVKIMVGVRENARFLQYSLTA